ncbi:K(+)/H(+) antiporter NhaP2 [bioreactor metagenome]|uniref:K(+)/H(+) antiporter NhaP2 n=1 Tax=bioreactor metagenome TaxID=1076179 RepID=A0A645EZR3_9ZZZZ
MALCLTPFRVPIRQQALIAWVGLRGAVPIILAMFPLVAGIEHANTIFSIVFFIAATSLLCQGMMIPRVASWLGLVEHIADDDDKIDLDKYAHSIGEIAEININETNPSVGKTIMELGLPKQVLIVMVQRKGNNITPNGSTELLVGDKLLVVAENHNAIQELKKVIGFRSEDKKVKKQLVEKPKNKKEK